MMVKRYLISAAINKKYENFLLNDWLKSLLENVDLSNIDILVLDFGLSEDVQKILRKYNVIIQKVTISGKIVNVRFAELSKFLKKNPQYEQVLNCDSGDMIFQRDISNLFEFEPKSFRAVCEDYKVPMDLFLKKAVVDEKIKKDIKNVLKEKKMINAGLLIAPRERFIDMCDFIVQTLENLNTWGMDQLLINYYLYRNGFVELDKSYNFIPTTHLDGFYVKKGVLYFKSTNEKIAVVHNAGNKNIFRPIRNFGYGVDKNRPRYLSIYALRIFYKAINWMRRYQKK